MARSMGMLVPETDRERLYLTWYDLNVLYHDALRRSILETDVLATKSVADDAWRAYVESIADVSMAGPRR